MEGRIDFLRLTIPGNKATDETGWLAWFEGELRSHYVPQGDNLKKWMRTERYYNNSANQWELYVELWGEVSHQVFMELPRHRYGTILRVDYRLETERPGVRLETIEHVVMKNRGAKARRTITRIVSPPRSKAGDRDAGGDFFAVGSKGSERRVTFYRRGKEPWAMEAQFGKGKPTQFLQEARDLWMAAGDGRTLQEHYIRVLHHHAEEAFRDLFHFDVPALLGEHDNAQDELALSQQEQFLFLTDQAVTTLDNDALAIATKRLLQESTRRGIMEVEGLEEPDDLWAGVSL